MKQALVRSTKKTAVGLFIVNVLESLSKRWAQLIIPDLQNDDKVYPNSWDQLSWGT